MEIRFGHMLFSIRVYYLSPTLDRVGTQAETASRRKLSKRWRLFDDRVTPSKSDRLIPIGPVSRLVEQR